MSAVGRCGTGRRWSWATPRGLILAALVLCAACDRVDQEKFDPVYRAGLLLNREANTSGMERALALLDAFNKELTIVRDRARTGRETQAIDAYSAAAQAYDKLLVYRVLGRGDPRVEINDDGTRREAARYGLPIQRSGRAEWINANDARRILYAFAETELIKGNDLVKAR